MTQLPLQLTVPPAALLVLTPRKASASPSASVSLASSMVTYTFTSPLTSRRMMSCTATGG